MSEVISYCRDWTWRVINPHRRTANEEERLRSLTRSYTFVVFCCFLLVERMLDKGSSFYFQNSSTKEGNLNFPPQKKYLVRNTRKPIKEIASFFGLPDEWSILCIKEIMPLNIQVFHDYVIFHLGLVELPHVHAHAICLCIRGASLAID